MPDMFKHFSSYPYSRCFVSYSRVNASLQSKRVVAALLLATEVVRSSTCTTSGTSYSSTNYTRMLACASGSVWYVQMRWWLSLECRCWQYVFLARQWYWQHTHHMMLCIFSSHDLLLTGHINLSKKKYTNMPKLQTSTASISPKCSYTYSATAFCFSRSTGREEMIFWVRGERREELPLPTGKRDVQLAFYYWQGWRTCVNEYVPVSLTVLPTPPVAPPTVSVTPFVVLPTVSVTPLVTPPTRRKHITLVYTLITDADDIEGHTSVSNALYKSSHFDSNVVWGKKIRLWVCF